MTLRKDTSEHTGTALIPQNKHGKIYKLHEYKNETLPIMWVIDFFFLKVNPQTFRIHIKEPRVTSSQILRWVYKLIAFDFDIKYIKWCNIYRQEFGIVKKRKSRKCKRQNITLGETIILPLIRRRMKVMQDPILSKILHNREIYRTNNW